MADVNENGFYGSGWSFPPVFEEQNHQLKVVSQVANINESIDLILMTSQGERTMMPYFGSGLRQFVFKNLDDTLKSEIDQSVRDTLLENEPRIIVNEVIVQESDQMEGLVNIQIDYSISSTNTRHNHVFPFNLREGTNLF